MTKPTVQVSLTTSGGLELILQDGRAIPLRNGEVQVTLERVLEGMLASHQREPPTYAQTIHWRDHSIHPDGRCLICEDEQRLEGGAKFKRPKEYKRIVPLHYGNVQVRHIAPAQIRQTTTKQSKELGL